MSWLGESDSSVIGQSSSLTTEVLAEDRQACDDNPIEPDDAKRCMKELQTTLFQKQENELRLPTHSEDTEDVRATNKPKMEKCYWQQVASGNQSEERTHRSTKPGVLSVSQQSSSSYSLVREAGVQQDRQVQGAETGRKSPESPPNGQQEAEATEAGQVVVQCKRYYDNQGNREEVSELRSRLKEVDTQLRQEIEQHQHEMTSLQQLHEHQLAQMKTTHEEELIRLRGERFDTPEDGDGNEGNVFESLLEDVEREKRQVDTYRTQLWEAQMESSQAKTECQRLSATLSSLEETEREKENIIQRLMKQVNQLTQEKQQLTELDSSVISSGLQIGLNAKNAVSSETTDETGDSNSTGRGQRNELGIVKLNRNILLEPSLDGIISKSSDNDSPTEKSLPSQSDLELEIRHLRDAVTSLSTTCEELEVEKTTLNEELERIKQSSAIGGEAKIRRNKTDDNKELETVQRRLHMLEDEVAKLISERDTFENSLEELDVQHQQAIEQILTSRDLLQHKYKQVLTENEDLLAKLKVEEMEKKRLIEFQKSLGNLVKPEGVDKELVQARETMKEFQSLWDFLIQQEAFSATLSEDKNTASNQDRISSMKYSFQETFNQIRKTENECHHLHSEIERLNVNCQGQESTIQELMKENSDLKEKCVANERLQIDKDEQFQNHIEHMRCEMDDMKLKIHTLEHELIEQSREANAKEIEVKASEDKLQDPTMILEAQDSKGTNFETVERKYQTVALQFEDAGVQTAINWLPLENMHTQHSSDTIRPNADVGALLREQVSELQQTINTLENRLTEKERYISGMDDILKVYKENLDPDQEAFKRQQLEMTQRHDIQVKNLESERDRMVAVLNDKARENSSLKLEVHRLVNVVSAERAALAKMQRECGEMSRQKSSQKSETDELTKETMQKLARLVHDREVEIEALQQKNNTLLVLLQEHDKDGSGAANGKTTVASNTVTPECKTSSTIQSLLVEREELSKQVKRQQAENEQIIISLNQKHQESVSYHGEIQRLLGMLEQESKRYETLHEQYSTVVRQFDEKQKAFLEGQDETMLLKRRLTSLEQQQDNLKVKYDRLLMEDESHEGVTGTTNESQLPTVRIDRYEWNTKLTEVNNLKSTIQDKDKLICEKDHLMHEKMRQIQTSKELCQRKEEELKATKQHVERLNEQLEDCAREIGEARMQNSVIHSRMEGARSEIIILKETNSALSITLQEREFELKALREKVDTLSQLVEQQASRQNSEGRKVEEHNLKRLLKESEEMRHRAQGFQAERDQALLALAHQQRENEKLREQVRGTQAREERLLKELDRLRTHLLQVEDSYTQEALRAEEREKELRNRLAQAEDRIQYATSSHTAVSHNASMQVESLQEQLKTVVEQRDEILVKLSMSEDLIAQKAAALHTLQVVLEQLQQERTRDVATAQVQHNAKLSQEKQRAEMLAREVSSLEARLSEASEALEAASRLSEQIDRKEEVIRTLREEVEFKEMSLQKAKHEIERFTNNTEVSVDRTIIKNLMVGFLTVPSGQQKDVLRVIATMLDFNKEEREKAGINEIRVGWISSWLIRKSPTPSSVYRPLSKQPTQQSLSQAFVRFLENESQPRPQVKFPVESLVSPRDSSQKKVQTQQQSGATAFTTHSPNPFTFTLIPQTEPSTSSNPLMGSSHLLMKPMTTALPTFTPTPVSGWSSSTNNVLRDVLEKD